MSGSDHGAVERIEPAVAEREASARRWAKHSWVARGFNSEDDAYLSDMEDSTVAGIKCADLRSALSRIASLEGALKEVRYEIELQMTGRVSHLNKMLRIIDTVLQPDALLPNVKPDSEEG